MYVNTYAAVSYWSCFVFFCRWFWRFFLYHLFPFSFVCRSTSSSSSQKSLGSTQNGGFVTIHTPCAVAQTATHFAHGKLLLLCCRAVLIGMLNLIDHSKAARLCKQLSIHRRFIYTFCDFIRQPVRFYFD